MSNTKKLMAYRHNVTSVKLIYSVRCWDYFVEIVTIVCHYSVVSRITTVKALLVMREIDLP